MAKSTSRSHRSAGSSKKARTRQPRDGHRYPEEPSPTPLQRAIARWDPVARLEIEFQRLGHLPLPRWKFDSELGSRGERLCCYTEVFGRIFGGGLFFDTKENARDRTAMEILGFIKKHNITKTSLKKGRLPCFTSSSYKSTTTTLPFRNASTSMDLDGDMDMEDPAKLAADAIKDLGLNEKPEWIFRQQNTKWACTVHTLGTTFGGDAIHDLRKDAGEAVAVEILTFIELKCLTKAKADTSTGSKPTLGDAVEEEDLGDRMEE